MSKKKAAILGATGAAGQQFVEALKDHPWFEIAGLYASERSEGKPYGVAAKWFTSSPLQEDIAAMTVGNVEKAIHDVDQYDLFFSALPSGLSKEVEGLFAEHKPVISTASGYRYEDDVPILVPEVNAPHSELIKIQQEKRGWKGFVVPGPNCTTMGLIISLKPIYEKFGVKSVFMTSMQALSGAGYPGHSSLDIVDNMIPFIAKEEGKVVIETVKTLGAYDQGSIQNAGFPVSCTCTRVAVIDGHMLSIFVQTEKPCTPDDLKAAFVEFNDSCRKEFGDLPSSPKDAIVVKNEENRPQPRLDREIGDGMSTVVGRIRQDEVYGQHGIKYVALSHNTKRGAAKGELMAAEYLMTQGYF
ncbi:MAG: aspartate-semialdehyde dehydrogenase [Candidatus Omnitrophica bacterium]|nr:aspartate-semialdehyde dehydrogenase [Candidatus Omnitrophota bacterium]